MKDYMKCAICAVIGSFIGAGAAVGILSPRLNDTQKTADFEPVVIASEPETEAATEAPTAKPTQDPAIEIPPKTEPTEPDISELIFENNNVKLYNKGISGTGVSLYCKYNNDSGQLYYITYVVTEINGEPFEAYIDSALHTGEGECDHGFHIPIEQLQDKEITRIDSITFNVEFANAPRSTELYFETGPITITR